MSTMFILIGASLLVAGFFLVLFIVSMRSGQFNDNYTPSVRMLFDDTPKTTVKKPASTTSDSNMDNTSED